MIVHQLRRFAPVLALLSFTTSCEKVPLLAPSGSKIELFTTSPVVPLNGSTEIVATVLESSSTPVQNGTLVTFLTNLGSIEPREARTNNGKVVVRFFAGDRSGEAEIRAFSGGAPSPDPLKIKIGAAAAERLDLTVSPGTVGPSGGTVQIEAVVVDVNGNRLPGVPVNFSTDAGSLSASAVSTDSAGAARTTLTTTREAKITATAGSKTASFTVRVNAAPQLTVTANPANPVVSQTISVTITPGANTGPLQNVTIDFGDGDRRNIGTIQGATAVAKVYDRPGPHTITVTGTDANGERATSSTSVSVRPITVQVAASPAVAATRQNVTFTATVSPSDAIISRYEWDFGDGTSKTTEGNTAAHSFLTPGAYVVRVRVVAQGGATAASEIGINITP